MTMTHGPREMAARNASRMRWKSASSSVSGTSLSATVAKQERVVRIVVIPGRVISWMQCAAAQLRTYDPQVGACSPIHNFAI